MDATEINFEYCIDCETNRGSCTEHCESICRCTKIDPTITSVNLSAIADKLMKHMKNKNVFPKKTTIEQEYAVDRLVRIHKMYEPEIYHIFVVGGYYGEEIGEITMNEDVLNEFAKDANKIAKIKNTKDIMRFLLEKEYGYLLDCLKDKVWTIEEVALDSIILGQKDHYKKRDKKIVKQYVDDPVDRKFPIGVVVEDSGRFRLIDGYHRYAAAKTYRRYAAAKTNRKNGHFFVGR
jgi:hypothetical protein